MLDADVLILDEAQRAKNFRTKTAATLRSLPSRFLFILTGTPIENRLDDLYSLLQLVDPSVLGPLWRFNLDFHQQSPKGRVVGCRNLSALRKRIGPFVLRRRKEEVLSQLPPLTEQTRYTALSREQAELEAGYRSDAARWLAIAERRPLSPLEQQRLMAALLKARQACDALELCDPDRGRRASPKLDELENVVTEIAAQGSSKVIVFSEWVEMLRLAGERLDRIGVGHLTLSGAVPVEKRAALLDRFREDPAVTVLLSSDAGGVGLNLQVASYVVHLDLPWNPARLDQRTSRAHRLGQTRGVSVTYLCSEQGIERGIEGALAGKRAVRAAALDMDSTVDTLEAQSFSVFLRQVRQAIEALASQGEDVEVEEEDGRPRPAEEAGGGAGEATSATAVASQAEGTAPPGERAPEAVAAPDAGPGGLPDAAHAGTARTDAEAAGTPHSAAGRAGTPHPDAEHGGAAPADAARRSAARTDASHPGAALADASRAQNRLRLARIVLESGFPDDAVRAAYEALAAAIRGLLGGAAPGGHAALVAAIYRDLSPRGLLPSAAHAALARLHDLSGLEAQGVEVDTALAAESVSEAEAWVVRLSGSLPARTQRSQWASQQDAEAAGR